jgi:acetyl esterase
VAGESAGANLSCAIAVATSWKRREAWALGAWNAGSPRAVLPACGLLQVSDTARFARRRKLPAFLADRMTEVETAYLGANARALSAEALEMADPLCVIERGALDRLGVECDARYYEGEVHAFHALVFRPNARRCWKATYEFLEKHL